VEHSQSLGLTEIAQWVNPVLRGWLNYYGRFYPSAMNSVWRHFNQTLIAWAMRKFQKLKRRKTAAEHFLAAVAKREPHPPCVRVVVAWMVF